MAKARSLLGLDVHAAKILAARCPTPLWRRSASRALAGSLVKRRGCAHALTDSYRSTRTHPVGDRGRPTAEAQPAYGDRGPPTVEARPTSRVRTTAFPMDQLTPAPSLYAAVAHRGATAPAISQGPRVRRRLSSRSFGDVAPGDDSMCVSDHARAEACFYQAGFTVHRSWPSVRHDAPRASPMVPAGGHVRSPGAI